MVISYQIAYRCQFVILHQNRLYPERDIALRVAEITKCRGGGGYFWFTDSDAHEFIFNLVWKTIFETDFI
jgi:hypothetical protein